MLIFNMSRVENIIWNNKEIKIDNKPFNANYDGLGIGLIAFSMQS